MWPNRILIFPIKKNRDEDGQKVVAKSYCQEGTRTAAAV
jgi:hypothetical protein